MFDRLVAQGQLRVVAQGPVVERAFDPDAVIADLQQEMAEAASRLEYERAALIRDQIAELKVGGGIDKISPSPRPVKYNRKRAKRGAESAEPVKVRKIDTFVDELATVVRDLDIDRFHLLGHRGQLHQARIADCAGGLFTKRLRPLQRIVDHEVGEFAHLRHDHFIAFGRGGLSGRGPEAGGQCGRVRESAQSSGR